MKLGTFFCRFFFFFRASLGGRLEYTNSILADVMDSADKPFDVSINDTFLAALLCELHICPILAAAAAAALGRKMVDHWRLTVADIGLLYGDHGCHSLRGSSQLRVPHSSAPGEDPVKKHV